MLPFVGFCDQTIRMIIVVILAMQKPNNAICHRSRAPYLLNKKTLPIAPTIKKRRKTTERGTSGTVVGRPPAMWTLYVKGSQASYSSMQQAN
jgi:hypothetical protein